MYHISKITAILIVGASMSLFGGTKLSKAAIAGDLDQLKACIATGEKLDEVDKWGWTPLLWAIYYRHEILTKWILNNGANPNIQSKINYGEFPVGTTPLGVAAYYGQENQIILLIASKADSSVSDSKGKKPIDYAKYFNFDGCISILSGENKVISNFHSSTNRIISDKLNDVFIVIASNAQQSKPFLDRLKEHIETEFKQRKIRFTIHVIDPLGLDEEKQIVSKTEPDYRRASA